MKTKKGLINIVTLGCSKNLVDSEQLARQLDANQWNIIYDSNTADAKTVIINTCGFINDAKEESIHTILEFTEAKNRGDIDQVFVMGCLSERYKKELQHEITEVDQFFGLNELENIIQAVGGDLKRELIGERKLSTPNHYAYLKISEGCNHSCSFCAIPIIRGRHKSKPLEHVMNEAHKLAAQGVKEIILIAQDLTYYGMDIYRKRSLNKLLQELSSLPGLEWIRLQYTYPANFPFKVLDSIKSNDAICQYLDIPFQHINDNVLTNMRRGITRKGTFKLIETIKKEVPNIALRTTLLVGHPGEDDKAFQELADFVKEVEFDRLGVFTYSEEEYTYGATHFKDSIPFEKKRERAEIIMAIQKDISRMKNKEKEGSELKVLFDRREGEYMVGRTEIDSPEVDNEVLVKDTEKKIIPGTFYNIAITGSDDYDLYGELKKPV